MAKSKGFDLSGDAMKYVYGFIGAILLMLFAAELLPEAQNASSTLADLNIPLVGLFGSEGVIVMILVVIVIVGIIKHSQKINK